MDIYKWNTVIMSIIPMSLAVIHLNAGGQLS